MHGIIGKSSLTLTTAGIIKETVVLERLLI